MILTQTQNVALLITVASAAVQVLLLAGAGLYSAIRG
jgi:hypothetical protein